MNLITARTLEAFVMQLECLNGSARGAKLTRRPFSKIEKSQSSHE